MNTSKPEQTAVNDRGTRAASDLNLTRGRSGPVRYELIDKDGGVIRWPRFPSAQAAGAWANQMWPDQQQDPERTGAGWDVRAVQS